MRGVSPCQAAMPAIGPDRGRSALRCSHGGPCGHPAKDTGKDARQCTPPSPSVTPPLAGEAFGELPPEGSPVRGAGGVSRLRGAAPCPANILPGWRKLPGGRERPPYNARQTGGITGDGRRCPGVGRLSAPTGRSAPCVGADEIIGPLAGLANGCCFLCYRPLAGLCRAGDFARRLGFAASQGFRDDASIVPYGCGARPCQAF